jgi:hypothetical protein
MTEQSSSKNYNLIHIVCEILALLVISFYFTSRINKLTKTIEVLCRTIEENEKKLEEHDKLIKQLLQMNSFQHVIIENSTTNNSSVRLEPIEEQEVMNVSQVMNVPQVMNVQQFMNIPQGMKVSQNQQQIVKKVENELDTESVLDAELEEEYRELEKLIEKKSVNNEEENVDNKKKSRSR